MLQSEKYKKHLGIVPVLFMVALLVFFFGYPWDSRITVLVFGMVLGAFALWAPSPITLTPMFAVVPLVALNFVFGGPLLGSWIDLWFGRIDRAGMQNRCEANPLLDGCKEHFEWLDETYEREHIPWLLQKGTPVVFDLSPGGFSNWIYVYDMCLRIEAVGARMQVRTGQGVREFPVNQVPAKNSEVRFYNPQNFMVNPKVEKC